MDILSLDYGDRRIGYATASESLKMAFAKGYFLNDDKRKVALERIISENSPKKIILGLPLRKDLKFTPATDKALAYGAELCASVRQDIFLIDERFTTAFSQIHLRESGRTVKNSKHIIDAESAKAIAETYLKSPSWVFKFTHEVLSPEKIRHYITGNRDKTLYFSGALNLFEQIDSIDGNFTVFELNPYCYSKNRNLTLPKNVKAYNFTFSVPEGFYLCS